MNYYLNIFKCLLKLGRTKNLLKPSMQDGVNVPPSCQLCFVNIFRHQSLNVLRFVSSGR